MPKSILGVAAMLAAAAPVMAQQQRPPRELRVEEHQAAVVTIALVDALPNRFAEFGAMVLRFPDGEAVIALPPGADVRTLDSAMREVLRLGAGTAQDSDETTSIGGTEGVVRVGVASSPAPNEAWAEHYDAKIQRVLDALPGAEAQPVRGFGRVPVVKVRPPDLRQWVVRRKRIGGPG